MDRSPEYWALIKAQLSSLVKLSEWDVLEEQLQELEQRHVEALITANHDWRYLQGWIQGIREARQYPHKLLARLRAE